MNILVDTNILVRSVHHRDAQHKEAVRAMRKRRTQGAIVHIVPQNLYEFWSVATRPAANNGLALSPQQANRVTARIEKLLILLRDTPAVYDEWRRLVAVHSASGKASHDARLVAAMNVHGIDHVLTFNVDDFKRYTGINVLHPSGVR
ncbi:MAG: type II toxin-antitoxin system VapC family toxin [Bryobacterales bacterium]|nr:type II toxin-antitoxin system VapC family toxin [Bryobacterales bacterium]